MIVVQAFALSLLALPWVASHPQCLDFLPPFTPSSSLSYCSQYSAFSCCSSAGDGEVAAHVNSFGQQVAAAPKPAECSEMLKEVSCARCSPYASHIYNAEATGMASAVAGLCTEFCMDTVNACGMDLVMNISNVSGTSFASASALCTALQPVDLDYCVPYVRNFTARLAARPTASPTGNLQCVCVKEVMGQLRNPVVAVHAGDRSHRLFVGEQLGVVRVLLPNGTVPEEPFIDLQDLVVTSQKEGDERGLLGMAFHPQFSLNGYVFFHLNVRSNSLGQSGLFNRVIRFTVQQDNSNKVCHVT